MPVTLSAEVSMRYPRVEEEAFEVGMRQNAMEFTASDANADEKLDFIEFCNWVRQREQGEHTPRDLRARFDALDANGNGRVDIHEYLMFSLRDALSRSVTRVLDLLVAWDADGSGDVSRKEFSRAIKLLGFDCRPQEIDALFDEMDADGSGKLDFRELNLKIREFAGLAAVSRYQLRRTAGGRRGAALGTSVKLDLYSETPISYQLRDALAKNSVRVMDLFRDWDEDGNGLISLAEFEKVLQALVVPRPDRHSVRELFSMFDPDSSGLIDFEELNAALRQQLPGVGRKPWVAAQVAQKLRGMGSADVHVGCMRDALCAHTCSALVLLRSLPLPLPVERQSLQARVQLDAAHRRWMMPLKGNRWTREPAPVLPPHLDFGPTGKLPPLAFSAVKPRVSTPRPPALMKPDSAGLTPRPPRTPRPPHAAAPSARAQPRALEPLPETPRLQVGPPP